MNYGTFKDTWEFINSSSYLSNPLFQMRNNLLSFQFSPLSLFLIHNLNQSHHNRFCLRLLLRCFTCWFPTFNSIFKNENHAVTKFSLLSQLLKWFIVIIIVNVAVVFVTTYMCTAAVCLNCSKKIKKVSSFIDGYY